MDKSFFTLPAPDDGSDVMPTPEFGPWSGPPTSVAGVAVAAPDMVARTDLAEIKVVAVLAYPEGVEFDVVATAMSPDRPPHELYGDSMSQVVAENRPPDVVLRFGVLLADDSVATTLASPVAPISRPTGHVIWRFAGEGDHINGNRISTRARLWLWPLPPPGRLVFATEWPAFDIGVTSWELDGAEIREAAQPAH